MQPLALNARSVFTVSRVMTTAPVVWWTKGSLRVPHRHASVCNTIIKIVIVTIIDNIISININGIHSTTSINYSARYGHIVQ